MQTRFKTTFRAAALAALALFGAAVAPACAQPGASAAGRHGVGSGSQVGVAAVGGRTPGEARLGADRERLRSSVRPEAEAIAEARAATARPARPEAAPAKRAGFSPWIFVGGILVGMARAWYGWRREQARNNPGNKAEDSSKNDPAA